MNKDNGKREKSSQIAEGLILKENRNDAFFQLGIGDKIWPQYEQLSIFFLFYWPHLGLDLDTP